MFSALPVRRTDILKELKLHQREEGKSPDASRNASPNPKGKGMSRLSCTYQYWPKMWNLAQESDVAVELIQHTSLGRRRAPAAQDWRLAKAARDTGSSSVVARRPTFVLQLASRKQDRVLTLSSKIHSAFL